MVAAIGALLVKFKSIGFANVIGKTNKFQSKFGSMTKQVKPALEGMSKSFAKFGAIASGVLISLIAASPRLGAEFEILTIRIEQFLRPFGDELAPIIRIVSNLVGDLTDVFKDLPQPVQDAATFTVGFMVSLGLLAGAIGGLILLLANVPVAVWAIAGAVFALKLAFDENFLGIQDIADRIIGNVVNTLGAIPRAVEALTTGDLPGFLTAVGDLFWGTMTFIVDTIFFIPRAFLDVLDELTGGLVTKFITAGSDLIVGFFTGIGGFATSFYNAGVELLESFFTGIGDAIIAGGDIIDTWLTDIAEFFGGSLPERGPLMHIETYGEELGQAYIKSIGSGIQYQTNRNSTTMNIQNLNLGFKEEQLDTERSFFDALDEGVRKSTSW